MDLTCRINAEAKKCIQNSGGGTSWTLARRKDNIQKGSKGREWINLAQVGFVLAILKIQS
jgi:hypothetical protein